MANIKDPSAIAAKWARVTPQRSEDYSQGVKSPTKDWKASTLAAADAQEKGVQQAITEKRFAKGVSAAGTEKWQAKAASKGVDRWGPGVQVAQPDYEKGFAPYAQRIASTTLPPRYPKGDPRNLDRVAVVAKALRSQKVGK